MRVYLDACALNRLTDDPRQLRVRLEAEAVELFFRHVLVGKVSWIASSILEQEIRRNPNVCQREGCAGDVALCGRGLLSCSRSW